MLVLPKPRSAGEVAAQGQAGFPGIDRNAVADPVGIEPDRRHDGIPVSGGIQHQVERTRGADPESLTLPGRKPEADHMGKTGAEIAVARADPQRIRDVQQRDHPVMAGL